MFRFSIIIVTIACFGLFIFTEDSKAVTTTTTTWSYDYTPYIIGAVALVVLVVAMNNNANKSENYTTILPAESEGKNAIQEQAKSNNIEILSFKKVDGKSSTNNGVATYEMYYELNAKGLIHKDKEITGKGSIVFEKREKGWQSIEIKGLPTDEFIYHEKTENKLMDAVQ